MPNVIEAGGGGGCFVKELSQGENYHIFGKKNLMGHPKNKKMHHAQNLRKKMYKVSKNVSRYKCLETMLNLVELFFF